MAVNDSSSRLGCGRNIDEVWDGIGRPPSAHEQSCPDCRQAREDLARVQSFTSEWRQKDDQDPELDPSPQVLDRILDIARAEVRRGRRLPLNRPTLDKPVADLTVSEQAVASVVRNAGDQTPGVQVRRVRVELSSEPLLQHGSAADDQAGDGQSDGDRHGDGGPAQPASGASATGAGAESPSTRPDASSVAATTLLGSEESVPSDVAVFLRVSVDPVVSIPQLSDQLRGNVITAVQREVGINVSEVDIVVEDIHGV